MQLASSEECVLSRCPPRRRAALPRAASNHPQAVKIRGPEFGCERRISAPWRLYNLSDSARCLLLLIDLQRSNGLNSNSAFGEVANNAAITLTDIDVRQAVDLMAMMLPFAAQRNCSRC